MSTTRQPRCSRDPRQQALLGRTPATRLAAIAFTLGALGFGGCAQSPQQQIAATSHGKEYFPASVYGPASRRVIADGQPVPRGGGQYLVGKPYTVAGQTYYPSERRIVQVGNASWYGDAFHGRLTANGEIYDRDAFSAAHPTMPLPSYARVTNLTNHSSMIVRVNDRGPYASNRIMDVSRRVAEALDFKRYGTARIKLEYVGPASLAGSDDAKLYATLRTGRPAPWQPDTMVAAAEPRMRAVALVPEALPAPRPIVAERPVERRVVMARAEVQDPERRVERRERLARAETRYPEPGSRWREAEVPETAIVARPYRHRDFAPETFAEVRLPRRERFEPVRVASREEMPHIPIRELAPAARPDRIGSARFGFERVERVEIVRPPRAGSRTMLLPPSRPAAFRTVVPGDEAIAPRRRPAVLRTARYRDD